MRLLSGQKAADFLQISIRKLDQLATDGEIRYGKFGVRRTLWVL